ncbi:MAG: hypothetical protein PHQ12_05210 [Chthoniobacteraceae bacterium]|nr:hypothetical protein [Chthoniobacteraceae bacterium]
MNLLEKIQWKAAYRWRLLRFRLWGKDITCAECGQPAGRVIVHLRAGRLRLEGLEQSDVIVDFASRETLRFRHADASECRKPAPPPAAP